MQRSLKRKLVIGLAALTVAAFAGGAYAATQNSTPNTRQAFLNDVAKRLHVTPQQLTQALNGATDDQLQAAVRAGQLTQAEANRLAQRLKQGGGGAPAIPFGFGFGFGPRFAHPPGLGVPGGPAGPRFFGGGLAGPLGLQGAAGYLGLTIPQLFQQLSSGKSLAQIATAKGKTAAGLEQAMTASLKTRLDKLVANKVITAAQEKTMLSGFSARVAQVISQKGLPFAGRFRPRFGGKLPTPQGVPVPPAYAPAPAAPPVA